MSTSTVPMSFWWDRNVCFFTKETEAISFTEVWPWANNKWEKPVMADTLELLQTPEHIRRCMQFHHNEDGVIDIQRSINTHIISRCQLFGVLFEASVELASSRNKVWNRKSNQMRTRAYSLTTIMSIEDDRQAWSTVLRIFSTGYSPHAWVFGTSFISREHLTL